MAQARCGKTGYKNAESRYRHCWRAGLNGNSDGPAMASAGHAGMPDHPITRAASGPARGSVTLIDTRANSRGATVPVGKLPDEITLTPDGKTAYVLNAWSHSVSVVSTGSGDATSRTIKAGRYPIGIAMTPSGNRVFITRHQNFGPGSVLPVKASTGVSGQPVSPPSWQGYISDAIAVAPDGRMVYAAEDGLTPWEGLLPIRTAGDRRGSPIKLGRFPYSIDDMAFTPDSKTLYVLSAMSRKVLLTPINSHRQGGPVPQAGIAGGGHGDDPGWPVHLCLRLLPRHRDRGQDRDEQHR